MKKITFFTKKLVKKLGIREETVSSTPRLTMLGTTELFIENHKGIIEYSTETVRLSMDYGSISIEGTKLTLTEMSSATVAVTGRIHMIMMLGGGK